MSHRAEQILTAVAAAISARMAAESSGVKVYKHRRFSLDPDQGELPGISVDYGEDRPAESRFMQVIDSVLSVEITAIVAETEERDARQSMLELRAAVHRAVMADPRFGIPQIVVTTMYAGAAAPEVDSDGERVFGALTSTWAVRYQMDLADPST